VLLLLRRPVLPPKAFQGSFEGETVQVKFTSGNIRKSSKQRWAVLKSCMYLLVRSQMPVVFIPYQVLSRSHPSQSFSQWYNTTLIFIHWYKYILANTKACLLFYFAGDSPYTCSVIGCTKAFKTPSDLRRHSRVHSGLKPFKCGKCEYRSSIKCNLVTHQRRHHAESEKIVEPVSKVQDTILEITSVKSSSRVRKNVPKGSIVRDERESDLPFDLVCQSCPFKTSTISKFRCFVAKMSGSGSCNLLLHFRSTQDSHDQDAQGPELSSPRRI
jgi:uncharacterized Zn-finger protein